jgi:metallopeptidase MepB
VGRLQRIVELRDEIARITGFANHAELRVQERMARSIFDVQKELSELKTELSPLAAIEVEALKELKRKDAKAARTSATTNEECSSTGKGNSSSGGSEANTDIIKYRIWDRQYYEERLKRERYNIDSNRLSEYFEVSQTIDRILTMYEEMFGLNFERVERASTWHETVSLYSVWDDVKDMQGDFLGYLYLDMFGRQGKTQQQYHSAIQPVSHADHIRLFLFIKNCIANYIRPLYPHVETDITLSLP